MPGGEPSSGSRVVPTRPRASARSHVAQGRHQSFDFVVVGEEQLQVVPQVRVCRHELAPVWLLASLDRLDVREQNLVPPHFLVRVESDFTGHSPPPRNHGAAHAVV